MLDGLSLDVPAGGFTVLLGPSGCGKSTLLAAVAGLLPVSGGRVVLGGRDITALEPGERDVAMVFQSHALYPTMTVAGNIGFGMRMRGVPRAEAARRLADVARLLRLESLLDRKPSELSGGERQRVAVGRALVRDPALFLFDEPLSSLDATLRTAMRAEIRLLHARLGTTCLFVTHDQAEAMAMANHLAVMSAGRIVQAGPPQDVYDRPSDLFVAGFVGSPGMNLVHGRVAVRDGAAWFEGNGLALPLSAYPWAALPEAGRPVVLGLRAEDIGLAGAANAVTGAAGPVFRLLPLLVEPTGADALVHGRAGNATVVARVARQAGVMAGQAAPFVADLSRASVFCPRTGMRL